MIGSLYAGSSGVKTFTTAMTVTGSNISNVNTVGHKYSRATFEDIISSSLGGTTSKIGKGVTVSGVETVHSQGTFEVSELDTDLAIDGRGFFVTKNEFDQEFYTRAGQFTFDEEGAFTTQKGLYVMVKDVDPISLEAVGPDHKINILSEIDTPNPTGDGVREGTGVMIKANLDAEAKEPTIPLDPDNINASMYNFSTTVRVHDLLGNDHVMTVAFRKLPDTPPQVDPATGQAIPGLSNAWQWFAITPGEELEGGTPGLLQSSGGGFLQFNKDGRLIADYPAAVVQPPAAQPGQPAPPKQFVLQQKTPGTPRAQVTTSFLGAGGPQQIGFDFGLGHNPNDPADLRTGLDGITQFAASNAITDIQADGNKAGVLENIRINSGGLIEGEFDSGRVKALGRITMAKFNSEEKLEKKGDNLYKDNFKSGKPIYGTAGTTGLGVVRSRALEKSNVDLANEFVRMIENQRAFQASAKTVTTSDEMIGDLITMKR